MTDALDRLLAKVAVDNNGCWIWTGYRLRNGYDRFGMTHDDVWLAHRASFVLHGGVIPDGLQLDHLCRVRACVNPAHLEPVTPHENQHRSPITSAGKTQCPAGHPYDHGNTYITRAGGRKCRECARIRDRIRPPRRRRRTTTPA